MKRQLVLITCLLAATNGFAAETKATLNIADGKGVGAAIGTVRIVETPYGPITSTDITSEEIDKIKQYVGDAAFTPMKLDVSTAEGLVRIPGAMLARCIFRFLE